MKEKRFLLMLSCINGVLLALMAAAVTAMVLLPFFLDKVSEYFIYLTPTLIFYYAGGALIFWFFWGLRTLIGTVRGEMAFTAENVQRLKVLSWPLLFLAVDFGYLMCYVPSFSKALCIIILVLGMFCARILAYLVGKAIEYKEDVDLTI